ncbi:DUF4346 domain-containing protein [Candidatus Aenigmatarchaeota archaeon]
MKVTIKINKLKCGGDSHCRTLHPDFWEIKDNKAFFKKGNKISENIFEIEADEKTLEKLKESALVCPRYAIDILDENKKSLLDIDLKSKTKIRIIKASYESRKEWQQDPTGFFTIKPFPKQGKIKVRFYNDKHKFVCLIEGKSAEDIYNTIVREKLVSMLSHAAYIGSELQKAELAMKNNIKYVQDDPLDINSK